LRRTNKTIYQKNTECFFFKNIVICGIEIYFIEKISKKIKFLRNFHISRWIKNSGYARFGNNFIILFPSRNRRILVVEISKWLLKVGFNLQKKRFKMRHSRKKINFPSKKIIKNIKKSSIMCKEVSNNESDKNNLIKNNKSEISTNT
jgi:hypothetical protein